MLILKMKKLNKIYGKMLLLMILWKRKSRIGLLFKKKLKKKWSNTNEILIINKKKFFFLFFVEKYWF